MKWYASPGPYMTRIVYSVTTISKKHYAEMRKDLRGWGDAKFIFHYKRVQIWEIMDNSSVVEEQLKRALLTFWKSTKEVFKVHGA